MSRAPYKYLDYYTFEDADLFFGREEETQKMVGEILSTRLLVLFSPSGSGKTSLINAGVRPALEKLGYETVYVRLDKDPIPSVQSAVAAALALPSSTSGFATSDAQTSDLHSFLKNAAVQARKPLVVFIDQFEEFFIVFENQPELRQQFIEQVAKIKYDDHLPVFLVLSLREDYFANLHEFREAIPSIFQNNANIRLEPFTEAEARRAIEEPVKVVGYEFEAGLVEQMLQDFKNGKTRIEPIKLQIVCDTVWKAKPAAAQQITLKEYKASGGADEILDRQVAQILEKAPGRERLLSRVLEALKTPDNTKRYRSFEDLKDTLRTEKSFRLEKLLHYLSEHHLLREEKREGTAWFEFKHDYLVGKISDWLQKREKEKSRKRLRYVAAAPGLALLLGILAYVFYSYNSFYFGFVNAEYPGQLDEIAVFRQLDPLHSVITTGLLDKEGSEENAIMRDHAAKKDLKYHFNLGFWQNANWKSLAHKLQPMQGALLLYKIGEEKAGFDSLVAALKDKDSDVRTRAVAALGNLGKSDDRVIAALVDALKDEESDVRSQAAATLGQLLHVAPTDKLFKRLQNPFSGERTASAQALARQDSLPETLQKKIAQLRKDERPWVRLGAWEAYELIQDRLKSEAEARKLLHQADSLFASGQWSVASDQYEAAFYSLKSIIRVDSAKTASAKFQQARCEAKLKSNALDNLEIAFKYNPTLRDTLQAEMTKPENDWKILEGNWYLREMLLKAPKQAPK